ncbi:MAG TPA: hypothetical protein VHF92_14975 [Geodermatophilus sp.]|nr:hypothetical protein [Geodermatophilus sp.]
MTSVEPRRWKAGRCDDTQQVIGVAEEPLGLHDIGDGGDGLLEGVDGVAVPAVHGDEVERLDRRAEGVRVEAGAVAADRAGALQDAQSAMAGRDAEPNPLGEFGDRQPPVSLHLRKNLVGLTAGFVGAGGPGRAPSG